MREPGQHSESTGGQPVVVARSEKGAQHERQEEALRVIDVEKIGSGENEQKPYGCAREARRVIQHGQPIEFHRRNERSDGRRRQRADQRVAKYRRERTNRPWIERKENEQQAVFATRLVAAPGNFEVMRSVPAVPDLKIVPGGSSCWPLTI